MTTTTRTTTPVLGRALLGLAAVVASTTLLTGCGVIQQFLGGAGDATRDDTGTVTEGTDNGDVFLLRVGDCIDDTDLGEVVTTLPIVPCADEHTGEVYAESTLSGDTFPGEDAVATQSDEACYAEFAGFVGLEYESSVLNYYPFTPTADSWAQGDRLVSCVVYDPDVATTTGSLAGAAR